MAVAPPVRYEAGLSCRGRLRVAVHDAHTGLLVARRTADNLIVTAGLAALASALNYALTLTQETTWGNPYAAPGAFYGAVGTSNTAASAGQTALVAEIGRSVVSNSAVSAASLTYDYFFGTGQANGVISEVGTFIGANLLTPALTTGLTSGGTYTTLAIAGLVGTIPTSSTLTVGYGTGTTQQVTTTSQVTTGASSIPVSSFVANAAYAAGSLVAYTPGTIVDRAVLGTPITKAASQTMTLELLLTLASG
jgi:hypothetical protein